MKKQRVIGIVGGMGPLAGVALMQSLVTHTEAAADQDHLPCILMSLPGSMTDRTAFLEGRSVVNPAFAITEVIRKLTGSGADVIGIACNTAHAEPIFDVVAAEVGKFAIHAHLLHMPLAVCDHIARHLPGGSRVGLMTTDGTYKTGLYRRLLAQRGYDVVVPDAHFQHKVIHRSIYDPVFGIKANPAHLTPSAKSRIGEAIAFFRQHGADAVLLGCTELSLAVGEREAGGMRMIDSTECFAKALIRAARPPQPVVTPRARAYRREEKIIFEG